MQKSSSSASSAHSPAETRHSRRVARRGAYILPSLFTMANVFCGYYALTEVARAGHLFVSDLGLAAVHFDHAAKAIGFAVLFDGLDGRIARLMGTTSPFGKELDSLADTITFGIAPAFLAFSWGVHAAMGVSLGAEPSPLESAAWVVTFLYVICSASRLARFNIQSNPLTTRPERLEHSSFVGLPTPAAAGLVASIVHFNYGFPMGDWRWVPFWLVLLLATSVLMVSTWRYHSFKDLDFRRRRRFVMVILMGTLFGLIWFYSHVVLLLLASAYWLSGILAKLLQARRRRQPGAQEGISGEQHSREHNPREHHA